MIVDREGFVKRMGIEVSNASVFVYNRIISKDLVLVDAGEWEELKQLLLGRITDILAEEGYGELIEELERKINE